MKRRRVKPRLSRPRLARQGTQGTTDRARRETWPAWERQVHRSTDPVGRLEPLPMIGTPPRGMYQELGSAPPGVVPPPDDSGYNYEYERRRGIKDLVDLFHGNQGMNFRKALAGLFGSSSIPTPADEWDPDLKR